MSAATPIQQPAGVAAEPEPYVCVSCLKERHFCSWGLGRYPTSVNVNGRFGREWRYEVLCSCREPGCAGQDAIAPEALPTGRP